MKLLLVLACYPRGAIDLSQETSSPEEEARPELRWEGEPATNLIVLSLDTFQLEQLLSFGGEASMPWLEGVWSESFRLDRHYSCSNWTFASMICAQLGQDPLDLGIPALDATEKVPLAHLTAEESLSRQGFRSALVTANPIFSGRVNLAQGFDSVKVINASDRAEFVVSYGLEALDTLMSYDSPWYLHLHFMDPHAPYSPPEGYQDGITPLEGLDYDLDTDEGHRALAEDIGAMSPEERAPLIEHLLQRYHGELSYLDDQLSALWLELEARGALEDSLVVWLSDHGEQIGEHGELGHREGLYEQETRSMVAFTSPSIPSGGWEDVTTHVDLWPTLLKLMGLRRPQEFTGLPLGQRPREEPVFTSSLQGDVGVQTVFQSGWKLHYRWDGELELYALQSDPDEQDSLHEEEEATRAALWEQLQPQVERARVLQDSKVPVWPELLGEEAW